MRKGLVLIASLLLLCASAAAQTGTSSRGYVIIVHPDNTVTSLTRGFVADAFLKRRTRWDDGQTIRPADQEPSAAARRQFSEDVLGRSVSAVRSYWQQIIFSGRGVPPVELDDDAAAVRYVLRHRGAIAYVSASADIARAKAVTLR